MSVCCAGFPPVGDGCGCEGVKSRTRPLVTKKFTLHERGCVDHCFLTRVDGRSAAHSEGLLSRLEFKLFLTRCELPTRVCTDSDGEVGEEKGGGGAGGVKTSIPSTQLNSTVGSSGSVKFFSQGLFGDHGLRNFVCGVPRTYTLHHGFKGRPSTTSTQGSINGGNVAWLVVALVVQHCTPLRFLESPVSSPCRWILDSVELSS